MKNIQSHGYSNRDIYALPYSTLTYRTRSGLVMVLIYSVQLADAPVHADLDCCVDGLDDERDGCETDEGRSPLPRDRRELGGPERGYCGLEDTVVELQVTVSYVRLR